MSTVMSTTNPHSVNVNCDVNCDVNNCDVITVVSHISERAEDGIELRTLRLLAVRSNQLSYVPSEILLIFALATRLGDFLGSCPLQKPSKCRSPKCSWLACTHPITSRYVDLG